MRSGGGNRLGGSSIIGEEARVRADNGVIIMDDAGRGREAGGISKGTRVFITVRLRRRSTRFSAEGTAWQGVLSV